LPKSNRQVLSFLLSSGPAPPLKPPLLPKHFPNLHVSLKHAPLSFREWAFCGFFCLAVFPPSCFFSPSLCFFFFFEPPPPPFLPFTGHFQVIVQTKKTKTPPLSQPPLFSGEPPTLFPLCLLFLIASFCFPRTFHASEGCALLFFNAAISPFFFGFSHSFPPKKPFHCFFPSFPCPSCSLFSKALGVFRVDDWYLVSRL